MVKIIYDSKACIGAGECAVVDPQHWVVNGKAVLRGSTSLGNGVFELDIADAALAKRVAQSCPVLCIKLQ